MLNKFIPSRIVSHFSDINLMELKSLNYKLILCDIDNTLVAPDEPLPSDEARLFLGDIESLGFEVVLISNNTLERVSTFNESLGLPIYPMALKPLKRTYKQIKKDYPNIQDHEMLSIGDQLLTDVFGSKRSKIDVVLTDQIVKKDLMVTKINRMFENQIIKILKWRGKWPSGNM